MGTSTANNAHNAQRTFDASHGAKRSAELNYVIFRAPSSSRTSKYLIITQ